MGPALRLTPLSPACGPCRSRKLYARRFNAASTGSCEPGRPAASHRPALAPAPVPSEAEPGPKTGPRRPAVPRPVFLPGLRAVRSGPKASPNLGTGPVIRPVRLCAFAASAVRDPVCLGIAPRGSPRLVPRPRGISPSRRYGSKIPSPSLAFRPLSRKGQSPSRCLEDALPGRFGQGRERALIHFRRQCQWTRVDNPTVRRKRRELSAVALREQPQA